MHGINGIQAVKVIKEQFPKINVVMQKAFENDENVFDSICACASGNIINHAAPAKILE